MCAAAVLPSITSDLADMLALLLGSDGKASRHALGGGQPGRCVDPWFRRHGDRVARALLVARRAPGAEIEVDPVEPALSQLDDRLLRARGVAVVALEAI